MTAGAQLSFPVEPEPIEARQRQRQAQRDDVLDTLQQLRAELIEIADRIAPSVQAQYGGVTGPRLLLAIEAAGFGEMLAQVPHVWIAGVLLPSRGYHCIGEAREGSNARPVKVWSKLSEEVWRVVQLEKALERAQAASTLASEARAKLPAGSSRKRVTSVNARWMRKAEERDRIAAQLEQARAAASGEYSKP